MFLLNFLRWFRLQQQVPFRILVGRSGDLSFDFGLLAPTDSLEPEPTTGYAILRRLKISDKEFPDRVLLKHRELLRERLLRSDIRLIYANSIVVGKVIDFLSFLGCPVICHVHELEPTIQYFGSDSVRLMDRSAQMYVAASHAVKANLVQNHRIPDGKIRVIHEFIPVFECKGVEDSRKAVRRELGIPEESRLVFTCGSIEPRKGPDLFLQVAERVAKSTRRPVHFVWVGGLSEFVARKMQSEVASSPLRKCVHFVGPRRELIHTMMPRTCIYCRREEIRSPS